MGRTPLLILLILNGAMFLLEVIVGWKAESMGLIADGLDMGADAAVYLLALLAIGGCNLRSRSPQSWSLDGALCSAVILSRH